MDKYEQRPNSGVLFDTKVKKHPKAPDYWGSLLVELSTLTIKDGKAEIKLSGWKRESKSGSTFLSIAVDTYKSEKKDDDVPF
jgi:hypothetical protein